MNCPKCTGTLVPDDDLQSWRCSNYPVCIHRDYRILCPLLQHIEAMAFNKAFKAQHGLDTHHIKCLKCGRETWVHDPKEQVCWECRTNRKARIKARLALVGKPLCRTGRKRNMEVIG